MARRLRQARPTARRGPDAATTEPDLRARIDASRAFVTAELGDLAGALATCDSALATDGVTLETRGVLHSQRALILLRQGDTAAALDAFDVGIAMLADPVELGKAHINRGGVHLARGAGVRAAAATSSSPPRLLDADRATSVEAAMAEHNLGYARLLQGDLVSALAHMDAVRPVLLPQSPVVVRASAIRTGPRS